MADYVGVPGVLTPANDGPGMDAAHGEHSQTDMTAGPDSGGKSLETPGAPGAAQAAGGNLSKVPGIAPTAAPVLKTASVTKVTEVESHADFAPKPNQT
jgi:hypothetical protein